MSDTDQNEKLKAARLFVMTASAQEVAEHIVNLSEAWQACQKRVAKLERHGEAYRDFLSDLDRIANA